MLTSCRGVLLFPVRPVHSWKEVSSTNCAPLTTHTHRVTSDALWRCFLVCSVLHLTNALLLSHCWCLVTDVASVSIGSIREDDEGEQFFKVMCTVVTAIRWYSRPSTPQTNTDLLFTVTLCSQSVRKPSESWGLRVCSAAPYTAPWHLLRAENVVIVVFCLSIDVELRKLVAPGLWQTGFHADWMYGREAGGEEGRSCSSRDLLLALGWLLATGTLEKLLTQRVQQLDKAVLAPLPVSTTHEPLILPQSSKPYSVFTCCYDLPHRGLCVRWILRFVRATLQTWSVCGGFSGSAAVWDTNGGFCCQC